MPASLAGHTQYAFGNVLDLISETAPSTSAGITHSADTIEITGIRFIVNYLFALNYISRYWIIIYQEFPNYSSRLPMRRTISFELHLPKTVKVDSVAIGNIPIDDAWRVTVRENRVRVGEMSLAAARRKFA